MQGVPGPSHLHLELLINHGHFDNIVCDNALLAQEMLFPSKTHISPVNMSLCDIIVCLHSLSVVFPIQFNPVLFSSLYIEICFPFLHPLQVREEVTSVFKDQFVLGEHELLQFDFLTTVPGMKLPNVSSTFSWNGQEVASLAGQGSLYILAKSQLKQHAAEDKVL